MVGVSGKSKACLTCRKRKLKCDEAKPKCLRCSKAGYKCAGYDTTMHFVNTSKENFSSSSSRRTTPQIKSYIQDSRSPSPELSLVAFKDNMCHAFLFDNFVFRTYGTPWLENSALGKFDQLSSDACQALSQSTFGTHHHQQEIRVQGAILYGRTLQSLIVRLKQPGTAGLMVPIMTLLLYSSSQGDLVGSISHVTGLTQLLLTCGPKPFHQKPLRSAFEACRSTLLTAALISKQRSFFEREEWQTRLWPQNALLGNDKSDLTDIMAHIPGFLEEYSNLSLQPNILHRLDLIQRITTQLEALYQWRWKWETTKSGVVTEEKATGQSNRPISTILHFSNLADTPPILLYHTIQLLLLSLLGSLTPPTLHSIVLKAAIAANGNKLSTSSSSTPLLLPGQTSDLRDLAVEVLRVAEAKIGNARLVRGSSPILLMPVGLAWSVLEDRDDWRRFVVELLNKEPVTRGYMPGMNGFGFGKYSVLNIS